MRIIAVMSPKGGIGKTTTSDAIAYMLGEEQEKRVLILDGDPQGDTSKTFEAYEPEGTGMSELLERHVSVGRVIPTTDLIRPTQYSHIDIIPCKRVSHADRHETAAQAGGKSSHEAAGCTGGNIEGIRLLHL